MTRITALVIAALLTAGAVMQGPPESTSPAETTDTSAGPAGGGSYNAYCPWSWSDSIITSTHILAAVGPASYDITPFQGGRIEDRLTGEVPPNVADTIENLTDVGAGSALVEFSGSPGVVGVVSSGEDLLAGDLCSPAIPDSWHLPGGSTLEGESLVLRLFNPFATDARVDIWAFSELGIEATEALEFLTVPARQTRIVALEEHLPRRESLSVIVRPVQGRVIPMMIYDIGTDLAVWPGSGAGEAWEFPVAGVAGLNSHLVMTNEASLSVEYQLEYFDESGSTGPVLPGSIEGLGQVRVPLDDTEAGSGIRVTGDGPFGAMIIGRSETGVSATVGARTTANTWLVPGPGVVPAGSRIRFLNAGVNPLILQYTTLRPDGQTRTRIIDLPANSLRSVHLTDLDTTAVRVSADGPFTVGWLAAASGRVMTAGAVPLE
ncbi:MAG: DUF5719 family protein [bacterium]|nr:DUF5719 family protein [bacterium]